MSKEEGAALKVVAAGAGIVFIGIMLSRFFAFIYRVIIARYLGPESYGLISIGISLGSIILTMALFGLPVGVTRFVSFYRSKGDDGRVKGTLHLSLKVSLITGAFSGFVLFLLSPWLATNVFHNTALTNIFRIFAIVLPFWVLSSLFRSALCGFERMKEFIFVETGVQKLVLLAPTIFLVFLGLLDVINATIIYALAIFSLFLSSLIYVNKFFPLSSKIKQISIRQELLAFSWPLVLTGLIGAFSGSLDTIMLGYFDTIANVGIYNAAFPIALLLLVVLTSFSAIFLPVATGLYAKNKKEDLQNLFTAVTKWIYSITLPALLLLGLFAVPVLRIMFGSTYTAGATALSVLAFGFFISSIVGPAYGILQTTGRTKSILLIYSLSFITNVSLNFILIPLYSIVGAAIATATSFALLSVLCLVVVYHHTGMQPYNWHYLKATVSALLALGIIYLLKSMIKTYPLYILILLLLLYIVIYSFLVLLFKGLSREDIIIMAAIERRSGLNLKFLRRIIKKFL